MVTPCNGPPTSSTPQDVDAWLLDAQERLAQLQPVFPLNPKRQQPVK